MKRIAALFLSAFLVLAYPALTLAETPAPSNDSTLAALSTETGEIASKDEVIYAVLDAAGKVEGTYVVNILEVTKGGKIDDYGTYNSVKNLTSTSPIENKDGKVSLVADAGKYYYQGVSDAAQLPWDITIGYTLDGKDVSPTALAGSSGLLEIILKSTANKQVNPSFYDNYLLQISITLDTEKCSAIVAKGGALANAGANKQITFTVMPGEDGDVSVSAIVKDFEMNGIDIAAVPFSMSIKMPDTSAMTDEMQTLVDAIADLNDGVKTLNDGVGDLSDGATKLKDGSASYKSGIDQVSKKKSELVGASSSIKDALATINSALQSQSGSLDLSALTQLPPGLSQMSAGLTQVSGGLVQLKDSFKLAYNALNGAINAIPSYQISQAEIGALYQANPGNATLDKLVEFYTTAATVKGTYAQVSPAFAAVEPALAQMVTSLTTISGNLSGIAAQLTASLSTMDSSAITQLSEGIAALSTNYGSFHQGLIQYTDGITALSSAYAELNGGIAKLSDGTVDLSSGVSELYDGTSQMQEETATMPEKISDEITKLTSSYDKSDYKPVSFTSENNDKINAVQFVLKTAKIAKPEDEAPVTVVEEPETFWTRLQALFK